MKARCSRIAEGCNLVVSFGNRKMVNNLNCINSSVLISECLLGGNNLREEIHTMKIIFVISFMIPNSWKDRHAH